jgi:hypothetical protein
VSSAAPVTGGCLRCAEARLDGIDVDAKLTAAQAAEWVRIYRPCTVQAIVNWRNRGHLTPADYTPGGRPRYRLLDVAKAEHATRRRARRTGTG